ncbi:hypothetical protein [Rhizobium hidalgonense]|nr:hypothetical protein [Rhizobium hidalgonense]
MRGSFFITFVLTLTAMSGGSIQAMPDFTKAVGLPEPKSITLYQDNTDQNLYWAPPTRLEYAFQDKDNKVPVFSITHFGIKKPSIAGGLGATLTVSVRAIIDQNELPQEWSKIKEQNPNARVAVIAPDSAYMDLILGSALFDKQASTQVKTKIIREETKAAQEDPAVPKDAAKAVASESDTVVIEDLDGVVVQDGNTITVINDPSVASTALGAQVGAYQAFAVSLTPDAGAVFATNGGEDASNFGVRYRYVVSGIRTRVKAEITVNWKRLYEHIHEEAGGGWFAFKGRHAVDLQKLKESGAVKMNIIEGGFESDSDQFETIYNTLVKAQINGEGIFKPTLTASPPPGAPNPSGSFFGWSFSGAWSYQRLEEQKDFTFTIDRQVIGKKSFAVGMAFQGMCGKFPKLFVAQGVAGPGCIDEADLAGAAARYKVIKDQCEQKTREERNSLYQAIGLLPNLDLQKIALGNATESAANFKYECIQGK